MVRSYALCTISTGAEGYAPPDYYRTISSKQDAEAFINEIKANAVSDGANSIRERECYHSIDNNLGRVVIKFDISTIRLGITTVLIKLPESKVTESATYNMQSYYVGYVNDINVLSDNSLEISYIVDWFTTSVLNTWLLQEGSLGPRVTAKQVLYRRLITGEFNYVDEGMTPTLITSTKKSLVVNGDDGHLGDHYNLFSERGDFISYILVYRESNSNATIWFAYASNNVYAPTPESIWQDFCVGRDVTDEDQRTFNPAGVIYYGVCPINFPALPANFDILAGEYSGLALMTDVMISNGKIISARQRNEGKQLTIDVPEPFTSKDYSLYRIAYDDGTSIYDFPTGVTISADYTLTLYCNFNVNAPYFTFVFDTPISSQRTFSVACNVLTFFSDSEAIYYATERGYQKEMRNLQATNELVSGIVGGVNQGAMISAFSRTGARTGGQAMDKGIIGGGMAIAGAVANYAYTTLYANKEIERIDDKHAKQSTDTLAMSGGACVGLSLFKSLTGLYCIEYDAETVTNIQAYQSAFGYQTNRIATDVNLDSLEGYVQADVIFYNYGNQRTPNTNVIKKYIKDMFNYGITFTKVA